MLFYPNQRSTAKDSNRYANQGKRTKHLKVVKKAFLEVVLILFSSYSMR